MEKCAAKDFEKKLVALKNEISEFVKNERVKKRTLKNEQQIMYDFILGKRDIAQFDLDGKQFFLNKGNKDFGLMHIICRHYGENIEGKLTFRDILNIYQTLRFGREITDVELNNEHNDGIIREINDEKSLKIFFRREKNGSFIITYYSTL